MKIPIKTLDNKNEKLLRTKKDVIYGDNIDENIKNDFKDKNEERRNKDSGCCTGCFM